MDSDRADLGRVQDFFASRLEASSEVLEFLRFRNVSLAEARFWGLGWCAGGLSDRFDRAFLLRCGLIEPGGDDRLEGRLTFPERLPSGEVVGFCGRALDSRALKFLTSGGSPFYRRSELLWGLHVLPPPPWGLRQVILTEGPFDVMALRREYGPSTQAVAVGGCRVSVFQASLLRRFVGSGEVVLALDSDPSGCRGHDLFVRQHADKFSRVVEVFFPAGFSDPEEWVSAGPENRGILRFRERKS